MAELRRENNAEDIAFGLFHAGYANHNGSLVIDAWI